MKQFFSFVRKEFYHILRDRRTVAILLGMPVMQILLFGFAISTELKNARVAVLDFSGDAETTELLARVDASPYFDVLASYHSMHDVDAAFRRGEIDMALVLPSDFARDLYRPGGARLQLIADGAEPNQASMMVAYIGGIIASCQQELGLSPKAGRVVIAPTTRMLYNPQGKSSFNFVPGVMGLVFILISAMMTSISIVREKELGTMEILLTSPIRPLYIILAKAMPYLLLSLVNLATILLLSVYVLGVPIVGSLPALISLTLIYIFLSLALGLLISSVVETQMAAMLASGMGLMMPIMLLSGMMFPIESMPRILQLLSNVVPARWYILGVKKIMIQGLDFAHVQTEFAILALMAVALMAVSLKLFRIRLQ